jgi:hypothetical protein
MLPLVLPVRAIIFQVLFLLVAIALEALIFRWRLQLPRHICIEYAVLLNLLATNVGWLIFFTIQGLPFFQEMRLDLIGFIFFNRFHSANIQGWTILAGFAIFIGTLLFKILGLRLLQIWDVLPLPLFSRESPRLPNVFRPILPAHVKRQQAIAVLWGHAASHSLILILLALVQFEVL